MAQATHDAVSFVPPAEVGEMDLYHAKTWLGKYVFSQDAKVIAIQYSITAMAIGLVALGLSVVMRLQLGFPNTFALIDPSNYLQAVTMHGMIMVIYLLTALFLGGFGNYLIPLMCGARDMVFPYMNMISYWVYLLSVIMLLTASFLRAGRRHRRGLDVCIHRKRSVRAHLGSTWGIILMLVSLSVFIVAFHDGRSQLRGHGVAGTHARHDVDAHASCRCGAFSWPRCWRLLAFPALLVSCIMMMLDRLIGTSFFMPAMICRGGEQAEYDGGSPVLFQHLFWFFGHPEVYIVALPAFGVVSDVFSSTHARKAIFGYRMMVWAIVAIGALSFVVWAHHMYVSGMNPYFGFFFATTTLIIAVPTAIKVYNWVLTLWRGNIRLQRADVVCDRLHIHVHQRRLDRAIPR